MKRVLYIIGGVILMFVAIYFTKTVLVKDRNDLLDMNQTNTNITNNVNYTDNKETIENEVTEEEITDEQEMEEQEDTEQEKQEQPQQQQGTEIVPVEVVEQNESDHDKAIDIAKRDWGDDDKVYFDYDRIDNDGKHIICVRDKVTTNAICWYTVDVKNGTCTME